MAELSKEYLKKIIDSADEVITALAGENPDLCKENTDGMIRAWDYLNDDVATPEVVRDMARQLLAGMEQEPIATLNSMTSENGGLPYGTIQFLRMPTEEERPGLLKLYAELQLPQPAVPVVNLPSEFYSSEGVMVQLEKVMAALAVCGIQYRRKGNACRAAMLQGTVENAEPPTTIQSSPALDLLPKNDESPSGLIQGAEPVSQPYMLPSREHFESLCCQFWNWRELDSISEGEEEPRLWWDGNDYTHRVTKALWRMYQAASQPHNEQQNIPENIPTLREAVTAIRNSGIAIDSEKIQMERLGAEFEEVLSNMTYDEMKHVTPEKCWCHTCRPVVMGDMRFVVCPECGNKRCPRANDCRNACSGSNDPGQAGSAYPVPQQRNGECDRLVNEQQNLVMLIKVLCRSLKKYNHSSELVKRATSYLTSGGFISATDCLRGELPGNSEQLDNATAQFEALAKLVAVPGD